MRRPTLLTLTVLAILASCPVGGPHAQVMPGATNGNALSPVVAEQAPAATRPAQLAPDAGGVDFTRLCRWVLAQFGSPLRGTSRVPARARRFASGSVAVRVPLR